MHNRELPPGFVRDIVFQAEVSIDEFLLHV